MKLVLRSPSLSPLFVCHALTALAVLAGSPLARAGDPPAMGEEVVVTATRSPRPIRDLPEAATLVTRDAIERSPAKTADELLVAVPSFDLFRRSSSLAADPSSQGVKLRGIGGTAVARTLVLLDGVPVNDPFAGWVAWRALPAIGIDRIEVVPGGGAALYGNYALGGVVQLISRPITPHTLDVEAEGGSHGTGRFAAHVSDRSGPLGIAVDGELFGTDGYEVVAPANRGAVDQATPGRHASISGRASLEARQDLQVDLRAGYFFQEAVLGTTFTTAAIRRLEYSGGVSWTPAEAARLSLTVFGHSGDFKQGRARIAAGRVSEVSSGKQDVPTDDVGASLLYQPAPLSLLGSHALSAGVDARWIQGTTEENLNPFNPGPASIVHRVADGSQRLYGVFVQDVYDIGEAVELSAAVRYDRWSNVSARRATTTFDGTLTDTAFDDRTKSQVDPKVGVRVRAANWLTLRASAYRAFRAPTLDELYRPFTVGQVVTLANENLGPETLTGAEAGFDVGPLRGVSLRVTGFTNDLDNPVTNVTIGTNLRQRQNLGKARIRGVEANGEWRPARGWVASASYTFIDATVTDAGANTTLLGNRLSQVPLYRATVGLAWDDPASFGANLQVRQLGPQFEDDLNALPLGEATLVDLFGTWHASRSLDLFLGVTNLLDKTFLIGSQRPGVDTIGQPRFFLGGLRFHPRG